MNTRLWIAAAAAALAGPGAALEGRWEGEATLAGRVQPVVLDIAGAVPVAVVTLPGRSVQRVRLDRFARTDDGRWQGAAAPAPGAAEADALQITLQRQGAQLAGTLALGGHAAALQLQRSGDAMALPPPPAELPAAVLGVWRGRYDIGFGPRELTLQLAAGGSTLRIIGRRTTELTLDEAGRRGALLMLRADAADLRIDAPWADAAAGVLKAQLRQGPFETAVELRREPRP